MFLEPEEERNLKIIILGKTQIEANALLEYILWDEQDNINRYRKCKSCSSNCLMNDGTYYTAISITNESKVRGVKGDQVICSSRVYDVSHSNASDLSEKLWLIDARVGSMVVSSILPEEYKQLKIQKINLYE